MTVNLGPILRGTPMQEDARAIPEDTSKTGRE